MSIEEPVTGPANAEKVLQIFIPEALVCEVVHVAHPPALAVFAPSSAPRPDQGAFPRPVSGLEIAAIEAGMPPAASTKQARVPRSR
jgi:hypothetical protein